MATRSRAHQFRSLWIIVVFLVGIGLKFYIDSQHPHDAKSSGPVPHPAATAGQSLPRTAAESIGGYEVYRNCSLAEARNNDGDSFKVKLPDGRKSEFRLYFVDTPESAFKSYPGGNTNHQRIRQQAAEMGGITSQQAVEIGKQGKQFTLGLLTASPFDIYTRWDSPFHDDRFHAFVAVKQDGKSRWLDEWLVERGLARIKTKPADLPDGTSASRQLTHLRQLERVAQRAEVGAWKR